MSHLLKLAASWISVVYIVCFGGVALYPGIREWFMRYALHTEFNFGSNIATFSTFVTGLVIWNIVALLAVWLYAVLNKSIKS